MIKEFFPHSNPSHMKIYFRIKAKNQQKVKTALENYLRTSLLQILESPLLENVKDDIPLTSIQVGHVGDNCIVMFDLFEVELTRSLAYLLEELEKKFRPLCIQATVSIDTAVNIKGLLKGVKRDLGEDEEKSDIMKEETGLIRVLLGGAKVSAKIDMAKQALHRVREMMQKYFVRIKGFRDKLVDFACIALRGLIMKVKLSDKDLFEIVKKIFERGILKLPDGADVIDEIGMFLSNSRLIEYYDNVPYIREFVEALHEHALADIEFGVTFDKASASISIKTEGVKELHDEIMAGMK